MMTVQPAMAAAMTADRPTAPMPKMAMELPGRGFWAVHDCAGAGLNSAAERRENLQRQITVDGDYIAVVGKA